MPSSAQRCVFLLFVACTRAPEDDGVVAMDDTDLTTGDSDSDTGTDPLALPRDAEAEAAVAEFLDAVASIDLADVTAIVDVMHAQSEPGCPTWRDVTLGQIFVEDCTTSAGTRFAGTVIEGQQGYSTWMDDILAADDTLVALAADDTAPGGWQTIDGTALEATFSLHVSGEPLRELDGIYVDIVGQRVGSTARLVQFTGPVNPSSTGLVPNLLHASFSGALGDVRRIQGTIAGLASTSAVDADLLLLDPDVPVDGRCVVEPEGHIGLRDASGAWRDVAFDATEGGPCDGCGVLTEAGVAIATVCLSPDTWSPP